VTFQHSLCSHQLLVLTT